MQVYGDASLYDGQGQPRWYMILTGGGAKGLNCVIGGQIPVGTNNRQWNWVLFRIPN